MPNKHTEHAMFTSTSGSNRKRISQSSPGDDESYGGSLSMLKSVHGNVGSSEDARLADDCCPSGLDPNSNYYSSCKNNIPTKYEHQSDILRLLEGVEVDKVAVDKSLRRTNLGEKSGASSTLSVKEMRRLRWRLIRYNMERVSRLNGVDGAEVATDKLPQSNVDEEVLLQSHKARRLMHNTAIERNQEIVTSPPGDGPNRYSLQLQARAAVEPIWRGRFDIVNKNNDTFEGFVAHLSRTACQPAIEEARLLPPFLQLEMVPKSIVWPKSFQTTKPTDYHIALYILPSDRRYEKTFDQLVNYMSRRELAMRTFTKNAELLFFSSTQLEMPYWRFQNKYYIWGVFRGKITSPDMSPADIVNHAAVY